MSDSKPDWKTLLQRGLRRKCPRCGEGPLFVRYFKLRDDCPLCGLRYLENQGDLWGLLLFADRVLFMVPLIVVFLVGQGAGSWWPYVFGSLLAIGLIASFPHRMAMAVALDYRVRTSSGDLAK